MASISDIIAKLESNAGSANQPKPRVNANMLPYELTLKGGSKKHTASLTAPVDKKELAAILDDWFFDFQSAKSNNAAQNQQAQQQNQAQGGMGSLGQRLMNQTNSNNDEQEPGIPKITHELQCRKALDIDKTDLVATFDIRNATVADKKAPRAHVADVSFTVARLLEIVVEEELKYDGSDKKFDEKCPAFLAKLQENMGRKDLDEVPLDALQKFPEELKKTASRISIDTGADAQTVYNTMLETGDIKRFFAKDKAEQEGSTRYSVLKPTYPKGAKREYVDFKRTDMRIVAAEIADVIERYESGDLAPGADIDIGSPDFRGNIELDTKNVKKWIRFTVFNDHFTHMEKV